MEKNQTEYRISDSDKQTILDTLEFIDHYFLEIPEDELGRVGYELAMRILSILPDYVNAFTHSRFPNEITAERDNGGVHYTEKDVRSFLDLTA